MDLDPEARRLLGLVREARTPSAHDKARVGRLLGASLALGSTAHAASGGAAAKTTSAALAVKWIAGVTLAAVAAGAGYVAWRPSAPTDAAGRAEAPVSAPAPAQPAAVVAPAPAVPPGPAAEGADTPSRAVRSGPAERPRAAESTLSEELDLLHEAQAKWRQGRASEALSLLAAHRKRFPKSQLGPERDALTVLGLCVVKRTDEARRVAKRFLATAPRSPLRTSVEESCGGK